MQKEPGIFFLTKNNSNIYEKEKSVAFSAAISESWMFREVNPNFFTPQNNI